MTDLATTAVVLARGLGTRMRQEESGALLDPAQAKTAASGLKVMIPDSRGRPFLDHILSSLADAGVLDVCLVVAPDHDAIMAYCDAHPPRRVRLAWAVQAEPIGTANALLAARPWVGDRNMLVLNSDNLYPPQALRTLVTLGRPGLIAFDPVTLVREGNFEADRVTAFALVERGLDSSLTRILEKPDPAQVSSIGTTPWVSMNLWRFDTDIFPCCTDVPISPRGEYELPLAVGLALERGLRFRAVTMRAPVLDLSRRGDVAEVARRLGQAEIDPVTTWAERVANLGLGGVAADLAARRFAEVEATFASRIGATDKARAWWIPGRIEVLGKHTDYGGGRSLLCTVERGFHLLTAPRPDALVRIIDGSSGASFTVPIVADLPLRPGHWTDYPTSVVRRIARDFPGAARGVDIVMLSSLPPASGLSSSSALVIATFLAIATANDLRSTEQWSNELQNSDQLAGYLGAMENGRTFGRFPADRGVGTHGGSEDHTAILNSVPGELAQYHFLPVTLETRVRLPPDWTFVIAVSGVHAPKGGIVQDRYNHLSRELSRILELWHRDTGRDDASLFAALRSTPGAPGHLVSLIAQAPDGARLERRLQQFREESETIIPTVVAALAAGDVQALASLVHRSQSLAETVLENQIPETVALVQTAVALGAGAASAFGAGFGGSVWALVPEHETKRFMSRWQEYLATFPARRTKAEFFVSRPGPAATQLP